MSWALLKFRLGVTIREHYSWFFRPLYYLETQGGGGGLRGTSRRVPCWCQFDYKKSPRPEKWVRELHRIAAVEEKSVELKVSLGLRFSC